jgi:hypothetical protein
MKIEKLMPHDWFTRNNLTIPIGYYIFIEKDTDGGLCKCFDVTNIKTLSFPYGLEVTRRPVFLSEWPEV